MTRHLINQSIEQLLKQKAENSRLGTSTSEIDAELKQREFEGNIESIQSDIRKLTKPHWSLVPIFWITLASLFIALLAYFRPHRLDIPSSQYQTLSSPTIPASPHLPLISSPTKSISLNKSQKEKP
jgi:hypothetical protein